MNENARNHSPDAQPESGDASQKRSESPVLGRPLREPATALTDLGCPDCSGVLALHEVGPSHYPTYACSVGHRFSSDDLTQAKEHQLETALWTAVETLGELRL